MAFYERFLYDINEFIEKYPNLSVDMLASVFSGLHIGKMKERYNKKLLDDYLSKSTGINKEQYLSEEESSEMNTRMEKFYQDIVPKLAHYCKLSALGKDSVLTDEFRNFHLDQTIAIMMQPDVTPAADRFNQRIADIWDYGTEEDKAGIIREFLDEVERIDLEKWAEKDTAYIMDHFAEYNREINMAKSAKLLFDEAVEYGYMKEDPARSARYDELYYQAEIDFRRTDFAVSQRISPLFSVFQASGLEKLNPVKRVNTKIREMGRAGNIEGVNNINALFYFFKTNRIRKNYEKFVEKCTENHISVPATLQEYSDRYAKDFKDFGPELSNACFEVLNTQKRKKCNPWETEKYKKGQKVSEVISEEDAEDAFSYDIFSLFSVNSQSVETDYNTYINAKGIGVADERYGRRYKDILESAAAYLGYRDHDQLPFVLGGEHNGELITNSGDLKKLSHHNEAECLYVKNKAGQIMSFALDYSEINGLSRGENAIRVASEEEILSLQKKQGAALRRKLSAILGENRDLENAGAGSDELRETLDRMLRTTEENDPDLNGLCPELADKASVLRDGLLNKSRTARLSDKEGKALDICEKLIELGNNSYIGVPDAHSEIASRMKENTKATAPTAEQVLLKMIKACDTLNATCSGIRNDSEEFKFLHESAKILRDNLEYAERNGIKMNADSLREEYRRVFTAAKKYMGHRKDMPTKNGRTQTRISLSKDLLALGEALECKELTAAELVAHSINDKLISSYQKKLESDPNSEKETKYLKKCLSDRKEAESVIRNNEFFCKTANGMTKDKLLKSAYSEAGRNSFIENVTAVRKAHEEAKRKKAAENPNNIQYAKDKRIYRKVLNNVQYTIKFYENLNLHTVKSRLSVPTLSDYFYSKMLLKMIRNYGDTVVNSDEELDKTLDIIRKTNEKKSDIKILIRESDVFKTMTRELKAEEIRKYGEHPEFAQMEFYVTQADKYFKPLEEEMLRKHGPNIFNVGGAVDNQNIINANAAAGNKEAIRTDKVANAGNSDAASAANKGAGKALS